MNGALISEGDASWNVVAQAAAESQSDKLSEMVQELGKSGQALLAMREDLQLLTDKVINQSRSYAELLSSVSGLNEKVDSLLQAVHVTPIGINTTVDFDEGMPDLFDAAKTGAFSPIRRVVQPGAEKPDTVSSSLQTDGKHDLSESTSLEVSPRMKPQESFTSLELRVLSNRAQSVNEELQEQRSSFAKQLAQEESEVLPVLPKPENGNFAAVFFNDMDVSQPQYRVEQYYADTGCCQAVARQDWFSGLTVLVVGASAIWMGIDAELNDAEYLYASSWLFIIVAQVFSFYFLADIVIRFFAFKHPQDCVKDGWFKFDFILVVLMIVDIWIIQVIVKFSSQNAKSPVPTNALRLLRLLKLTRMGRLGKMFPELVTMIRGLVGSLRAILSTLLLVLLLTFTVALVMLMLLKPETEINKDLHQRLGLNFSTLPNCMWTLFMDATLLLDGSTVFTELLYANRINPFIAGVILVMFTLVTALCILQMLIGVLCDVVSRVGANQRDGDAIALMKQEVIHDLHEYVDENNKVSRDKLHEAMSKPETKAVLKQLNINQLFLTELQKAMFAGGNTGVSIKAVTEMMLLCRGDNAATVEALASGFHYIVQELYDIRDQLCQEFQAVLKLSQTLKHNGSGAPRRDKCVV